MSPVRYHPSTGIRPRFVDDMGAHGIVLPIELFRPDARFEG